MLRLDKFLCDVKVGSRSQVKEYLKKGMVKVNGEVVKRPEFKVDEKKDGISFQGKEILYKRYVYYMLNKPKGVVSATRDACRTVTDLLKDTGYDGIGKNAGGRRQEGFGDGSGYWGGKADFSGEGGADNRNKYFFNHYRREISSGKKNDAGGRK